MSVPEPVYVDNQMSMKIWEGGGAGYEQEV